VQKVRLAGRLAIPTTYHTRRLGVQAQRTVSAGGAFLIGAATALLLTGDATVPGENPVPEVPSTEANLASILEQAVLAVVALLFVLLVVYLVTCPSNKWCENCGYDVGTDPPNNCPNCGFNVFVEEKPPAGGVKAIKQIDDND
jgi:DNA-directed RNA polymerase subunit RPC12/RpoP